MRFMKSASRTSLRRMRSSSASHSPVSAGLLTWGWTDSIRRMPVSVAASALPCRSMYWRRSSVSMISARVAGVPRPRSFMAADSSRSSSVAPAVSMAVSSVASLKRRGGRVFFLTASTPETRRARPAARPGGRSCSLSSSSALFPFASLRSTGSRTFQPSCWMAVPLLAKRSRSAALVTSVTTLVTEKTCSSCQAMSSRRQTRS